MASCGHRTCQSSRVGASNTRRRARDIPEVARAPERRVQQVHFGIKAVNVEGKYLYKSHKEYKYYLDVPLDADILVNSTRAFSSDAWTTG